MVTGDEFPVCWGWGYDLLMNKDRREQVICDGTLLTWPYMLDKQPQVSVVWAVH